MNSYFTIALTDHSSQAISKYENLEQEYRCLHSHSYSPGLCIHKKMYAELFTYIGLPLIYL